MSKLIVPEHVAIAREKKKQEEEMVKVPNPTGWRIVILPHKGVEKTKGGVILSDQLIQEQQWTTNVGPVPLLVQPVCTKPLLLGEFLCCSELDHLFGACRLS